MLSVWNSFLLSCELPVYPFELTLGFESTSKCFYWGAGFIIKCSRGNASSFFPDLLVRWKLTAALCTNPPTQLPTHTHIQTNTHKVWMLDRICLPEAQWEKSVCCFGNSLRVKPSSSWPIIVSHDSQRPGEFFIMSPSAEDVSHLFHTALSWLEFNGSQPNPAYQMLSKYCSSATEAHVLQL